MFHALNALGKKVVLYMYPFEDHSPQARETILDLWARWIAWLDEHLKGPEKPKEEDQKANAPPPGDEETAEHLLRVRSEVPLLENLTAERRRLPSLFVVPLRSRSRLGTLAVFLPQLLLPIR
jgi:hypothetical protein